MNKRQKPKREKLPKFTEEELTQGMIELEQEVLSTIWDRLGKKHPENGVWTEERIEAKIEQIKACFTKLKDPTITDR